MDWMPIRHSPRELFTAAQPRSWRGRIVQFPLTRIVVTLLFLAPVAALHNLAMIYVIEPLAGPLSSALRLIETVVNLILFVVAYRIYARWIEKRPAVELSAPGCTREITTGMTFGAGLVFAVTATIVVFGSYRVVGTGSPLLLLQALTLFGIGAFIQELFFRGIVFRLTEELLGTWMAVACVAALFGALHLGNENATIWTSCALIVSDLLFTGAFVLSRRLWLVWGIHWGWNFAQDGILGMPNSGITTLPSWLDSVVSGPIWLTGGRFGIEMSALGIALSVGGGILLLRWAAQRGQVIGPRWSRRTA